MSILIFGVAEIEEVSMKRRARFVENASEETTCDDTANLDLQNDALAKSDPE